MSKAAEGIISAILLAVVPCIFTASFIIHHMKHYG